MKIHENETLINRNKMRIEELTIQMEGSQEIKEQWKEQNKNNDKKYNNRMKR